MPGDDILIRSRLVHYTNYYVASFVFLGVMLVALVCLLLTRMVECLQQQYSNLWAKADMNTTSRRIADSVQIGILGADQQFRSPTGIEALTGQSTWKARCV